MLSTSAVLTRSSALAARWTLWVHGQEVGSSCISGANRDARGVPRQTTDNRLCALVPPPYYPMTRYHGVIALRAQLRKADVPQPPRDVRPSCSAKRSSVAAEESKNHDARAALSVCAQQEDGQLMIAPANARSRGEAPGKPCSGSHAMALESSSRRENPIRVPTGRRCCRWTVAHLLTPATSLSTPLTRGLVHV